MSAFKVRTSFIFLLWSINLSRVSPKLPVIHRCLQPASLERAELIFDDSDVDGFNVNAEDNVHEGFHGGSEICPSDNDGNDGVNCPEAGEKTNGDVLQQKQTACGQESGSLQGDFHYNASIGRV